MKTNLFIQGISSFLSGAVCVALLIFVPAGSIQFPNGLLFMALMFVPMFIGGLWLFHFNPELLNKRLNAREVQREQKIVVLLTSLLFIAAFILAGLNYRFQWVKFPRFIVAVSSVVFFAAYLFYAEVFRENHYLSRAVVIQRDHKVIDRGLYGVVRHPMYTATVFLFLSMPLVLGSPVSFLIMLLYIPVIRVRILSEERLLRAGLPGYEEYTKKVRYRLIPFVW